MRNASDSSEQTGWRAILPERFLTDLGVMALFGVFFAAIGPFDTIDQTPVQRVIYWMITMLLGLLVIRSVEAALKRIAPIENRALRIIVVAALCTPPQTAVVFLVGWQVVRYRSDLNFYVYLLFPVFIIALAAVSALELARWTRARGDRPTREAGAAIKTSSAAPEAIARHLPAPLRTAELIALQAEDHYVRVHTSAGSDLVLMRFSDAVAAADDALRGFRLHRSWWASEASLEAVSYKRGSGQARLQGGITAPVSRTYYPALKEAGWA